MSSTPPPSPPSSKPTRRINWVDVFLYGGAAVSYISLSIEFKWLLDWIVGPLWLVMWVWGGPALWRWVHKEPIRPRRGPDRPVAGESP